MSFISNDSLPVSFRQFCAIISPLTPKEVIKGIQDECSEGRIDWEAITVYANRANLAPALRHGLSEKGLFNLAPENLRDYLNEMYGFNAERNKAIFQHLQNLVRILNHAGITPLPLKGGAALATDLYPDPAIRFMMDLDILVPDNLYNRTVSVLKYAGYEVPELILQADPHRGQNCDSMKHYLPLVRSDAVAHVEVHRKVFHDAEERILPTEEIWKYSRSFTDKKTKEFSIVLMSPTHQILHCIIHSEMSHGNHRMQQLDLRQMLHFSYLCWRYRDEIEWDLLATYLNNDSMSSALKDYLYTAQRLFFIDTPFISNPAVNSLKHFSDLVHYRINGKHRLFRRNPATVVRDEIAHLFEAFSEQGLKLRLPEDKHGSVTRMRLQYLMALKKRYSSINLVKGYFDRSLNFSARLG